MKEFTSTFNCSKTLGLVVLEKNGQFLLLASIADLKVEKFWALSYLVIATDLWYNIIFGGILNFIIILMASWLGDVPSTIFHKRSNSRCCWCNKKTIKRSTCQPKYSIYYEAERCTTDVFEIWMLGASFLIIFIITITSAQLIDLFKT